MRALRFHGVGDLRLEEVPRPEPGPGDVLVQVEVALTDGTDLKAFRRGHPVLLGELPSPFTELPGCAFRDRCPHAREACRTLRPELTEAAPGHRVMCTLHGTPSD